LIDRLIEQGLMSPPTQYRLYGQVIRAGYRQWCCLVSLVQI